MRKLFSKMFGRKENKYPRKLTGETKVIISKNKTVITQE